MTTFPVSTQASFQSLEQEYVQKAVPMEVFEKAVFRDTPHPSLGFRHLPCLQRISPLQGVKRCASQELPLLKRHRSS